MNQELLNGIGAQPMPQPVVKKKPREMTTDELREYHRLASSKNYKKNRERILKALAAKRQENPEQRRLKEKEYYVKNRNKILSKKKEWREKNPKKIQLKAKRYYLKNKELSLLRTDDWRAKNREYLIQQGKNAVKSLNDKYIINKLRRLGFIKPTREMIDAKKLDIFIKRCAAFPSGKKTIKPTLEQVTEFTKLFNQLIKGENNVSN